MRYLRGGRVSGVDELLSEGLWGDKTGRWNESSSGGGGRRPGRSSAHKHKQREKGQSRKTARLKSMEQTHHPVWTGSTHNTQHPRLPTNQHVNNVHKIQSQCHSIIIYLSVNNTHVQIRRTYSHPSVVGETTHHVHVLLPQKSVTDRDDTWLKCPGAFKSWTSIG